MPATRAVRISIAVVLALSCIGCGGSDPNHTTQDASTEDSGALAGDAGDAGVDTGPPAPSDIHFVVPSDQARVASQPVALRVVVDALVDRVDIVLDGSVTANLPAPYEWTLDSSVLAPGPHVLVPRAVRGTTMYDGTPITLIVDRTAPAFVRLEPTGMGLMPDARTPFELELDEPLAPSSLTSATFTVSSYRYGEGTTPVAGALTLSGSTITFTPESAWAEDGTINLTLSGTVTDVAGNATTLTQSFYGNVRTYWTTPTSLANAQNRGTVHGNGDYLFGGVIPAYSNATVGSIGLTGVIDGVDVNAPTIDPAFTVVRFVSTGLDAHGVAYVLFEEYAPTTFERAWVVARRDPITAAWSKQILVPTDVAGAIDNPALVVAGNGHAYVQFYTGPSSTLRVFHRAPADATFTELADTTTAVGLAVPDVAFPGTAGRRCNLESEYVPQTGTLTYLYVCRDGGAASKTLVLGDSYELGVQPAVSANANGDALVVFEGTAYFFEGATETITTTTIFEPPPFGGTWGTTVALGPEGHACVFYAEIDPAADYVLRVIRKSPGSAFEAAERAVALPIWLPSLVNAAVDAAGQCFLLTSMGVTHDATPTGAFTRPFMPSASTRVYAGLEDQAFLTAGTSNGTLYHFAPLSP